MEWTCCLIWLSHLRPSWVSYSRTVATVCVSADNLDSFPFWETFLCQLASRDVHNNITGYTNSDQKPETSWNSEAMRNTFSHFWSQVHNLPGPRQSVEAKMWQDFSDGIWIFWDKSDDSCWTEWFAFQYCMVWFDVSQGFICSLITSRTFGNVYSPVNLINVLFFTNFTQTLFSKIMHNLLNQVVHPRKFPSAY